MADTKRRKDTPAINENGAPFWQYCDTCGAPMYSDEYCEHADIFCECEDCEFQDPWEDREDFFDDDDYYYENEYDK